MNRLEIAGYGYPNASQLLGDANRFTAVAADGLSDTLAGGAGMAGDSSIADDFAAAYDEGAAGLVAALDDVVDAFANLCRLAYCSFENHYRAEASSIASTVVFSTEPSALSTSLYAGASPVPPSVLGGDASFAPGWANVILDHVEGFVWPDADVDRLRSTADAWHRTADQLDFVVGLGGRAILELFEERSPEIPLATQAIGEVRCGLREIVDGCHQLARACDDYAEAVETQREAILDLVRDLIRDAVLIQAAGFVLGLVTAGSGNAVAAWVNSGKLAAELPRFKAILDAIRAAGAAVAGPVRAGSASVVRVRDSLKKMIDARMVISGGSERGSIYLVKASTWLGRHEGGAMKAHTLTDHVGKSDEFLRLRLLDKPNLVETSTFTDEVTAARAIRKVLSSRKADVSTWLASSKAKMRIDDVLPYNLGRIMNQAGEVRAGNGIRVILVKDSSMPKGYRILTSFVQ